MTGLRRGLAQIFCGFFLFVSFCVYHVLFILFLGLGLSDSSELDLFGAFIWCKGRVVGLTIDYLDSIHIY